MFLNTITLFNVMQNNDNTTYHRSVISNVFYYVNRIISNEGNGEKYTTAYHVIFSEESLENYVSKKEFDGTENTFTLRENDIIVLGEYETIEDLKELQQSKADFFLIKTIGENLYGDNNLQNIEVTN